MKVHGGKELVTTRPPSLVFARAHRISSCSSVCTYACSCTHSYSTRVYLHTCSTNPSCRTPVSTFARVCVCVFPHERVSQPTNQQLPRHELLFLSLAKREAGWTSFIISGHHHADSNFHYYYYTRWTTRTTTSKPLGYNHLVELADRICRFFDHRLEEEEEVMS